MIHQEGVGSDVLPKYFEQVIERFAGICGRAIKPLACLIRLQVRTDWLVGQSLEMMKGPLLN